MELSLSRTTRALALLTACSLTGCGGGGEDDNSVSLAFVADSQAPDPVVLDFPVAYVSRELDPDTPLANSPRELNIFNPGAALMLKDRAEPSAPEINLLEAFGEDAARFDVRDLEADYDGSRLVFSMRGPFDDNANDDEQPSWNIWIYDRTSDELRRIIDSDTLAEAGNDRDPYFLPDGRIVFSSDRQRRARAILLDEGRPQFAALDEDRRTPAFVLHTMNDDGTNIEQISFNQSHDQDPTVDPDGRIVFTRWDNVPGRDAFSLYRMDPDGTELERLYGYHSQNSGPDGERSRFTEAEVVNEGSAIVFAIDDAAGSVAGRLLVVDTDGFVDAEVPTVSNAGDPNSGQRTLFEASTSTLSIDGRFADAAPLFDGTNRLLTAWAPCRQVETNAETNETTIVPCTAERLEARLPEADPLFGLWMFDPEEGTQQPVVTPVEGIAITEAAVLADRVTPFARLPGSADTETQDLIDRGMGVIDIRSVYDIDGTDTTEAGLRTLANPTLTPGDSRPYRFVRLVKPVSIPDDDVIDIPRTAFGRSTGELMREIVGYGLVHPDGSIRLEVPANVPFAISLLDGDGRRATPRHRNWLQVRPGETLSCNGCHGPNSTYPHGRRDAEAPSINDGAPWSGLSPALLIETGETIAQGVARQFGTPSPSANLVAEDIWTDPDARALDNTISLRYEELQSAAPLESGCLNDWQASCRITIHYPEHIHPLWNTSRVTVDADNTCTACHSPTDAMNAAQVPAAQLDLTDGPSTDQPDHLKSYRELLFGDVEQEVVNGALIDRLVPVFDNAGNQIFETDEDGELILDAEGNPIPVLTTVGVRQTMFTGGARSSDDFFEKFDEGGSHEGFLSLAELRLIAEWLDVGGQYYNDPFEVSGQ